MASAGEAQLMKEWRDNLTSSVASLDGKVDVLVAQVAQVAATTSTANQALDGRLTDQRSRVSTLETTIDGLAHRLDSEILSAAKEHEQLRAGLRDHANALKDIQDSPSITRARNTFYVVVAGVVLATLCSTSAIIVSIVGLIVNHHP